MDVQLKMLGCSITCIIANKYKSKVRKKWSRCWLQKRKHNNGATQLLRELEVEDPRSYRNFLRLSDSHFDHLLDLIIHTISKTDTLMRECVPSRNKLEVTLRFLVTGETYRSLMYNFRIHESTISRFLPVAIIAALRNECLKTPNTKEDWNDIADDFDRLWQFPHCIGALDGRHINLRVPTSAGSYYYNYKGTNSVVVLTLVDANYKFIYVNIGVNGRISDGGVFNESALGIALKNNTLPLPVPKTFPGQSRVTPFVVIADDAFSSLANLVKPYSGPRLAYEQRVYNYRVSRARRIVESAFGILANRFRVLLTPINLSPTKVENVTLTCVLLHNFLAKHNPTAYTNLDKTQKIYCLDKINRQSGNKSSFQAREVREHFKAFFNSPEGAVSWEDTPVKMQIID